VTESATSTHHDDVFSILDDIHLDGLGAALGTLDAGLAELNRLARTPWGEGPNRPPCLGWETCGRSWVLREHAGDEPTLADARMIATLEMSEWGPQWSLGPDAVPSEQCAIGPRIRRGRARRIQLRHTHHDPRSA
jgi:hypothetical protein